MEVADAVAQKHNVALVFDSGDSGNMFVNYSESFPKPGIAFYPDEGTLGLKDGAVYSYLHNDEVDAVVVFSGDRGAGYSPGEMPDIAKLAKEKGKPVVMVVLNNTVDASVIKGTFRIKKIQVGREFVDNKKLINAMKREAQNNEHVLYHKYVEAFPALDPKGVFIDGNDPQAVAAAVTEALNSTGRLTVVEVGTKDIKMAPPQQMTLEKAITSAKNPVVGASVTSKVIWKDILSHLLSIDDVLEARKRTNPLSYYSQVTLE